MGQQERQEPTRLPTKKTITNRLNFASAFLGPIVGAAIAVWGLSEARNQTARRLNEVFGQSQVRELDPNSLNTIAEPFIGLEETQLAILRFQIRKYHLNDIFYEFAQRTSTDDSLDTFHQIATEHLFDGIKIINKHTQQNTVETVIENGILGVKLDEQFYNLANPLQFQALYALTSLKLDAISQDTDHKKENADDDKTAQQERNAKNILDQQAIRWLKDQELNVGFIENGLLLADAQSLAAFARTLAAINRLGYENPRIGFFGPDKRSGGRFIEKGPSATNHTAINYSSRYGNIDSLVHELGHYLETVSQAVDPAGSYTSFDQQMKDAENKYLLQVQNKDELHNYLHPNQRQERDEQYAGYFKEYILRGNSLRAQIAQLHKTDPAAAQIYQTAYDFFKKLFKNQEFIEDGLTEEELRYQLEQLSPKAKG